MKEERLAREKEIETEQRLRQKAPRATSVDIPEKMAKKGNKNLGSNVRKEITSKVTKNDINDSTDKSKRHTKDQESMHLNQPTDVFDVLHQQLLAFNTPPKPVVLKIETSNSSKKEVDESSKNFTGDINSPQPIDCTDDTQVTNYTLPSETMTEVADIKAFDISGILQAANENIDGQPRTDRTPYRSSTMKSQLSTVPSMRPLIDDIDVTPVKYSEVEVEDEPSEFAKQLQLKKEAIVKLGKEKNLNLELKVDEKKAIPTKPPRLPPTYSEFLSAEPTEVQCF